MKQNSQYLSLPKTLFFLFLSSLTLCTYATPQALASGYLELNEDDVLSNNFGESMSPENNTNQYNVTFVSSGNDASVTLLRIKLYSSVDCSGGALPEIVYQIPFSLPTLSAGQSVTYHSTDASNFDLCSVRYLGGGQCSNLAQNVRSMQYSYKINATTTYTGNCQNGDGITGNWIGFQGSAPCTSGADCGFAFPSNTDIINY